MRIFGWAVWPLLGALGALLLHAAGDAPVGSRPAATLPPEADSAVAEHERLLAETFLETLNELALPDLSPAEMPEGGRSRILWEFLDPLCPVCVAAHPEVVGFLEDHPEVAWRVVLLPLRGTASEEAAAALAEAPPETLPLLMEQAMQGRARRVPGGVFPGLERRRLLAEALGVRGTPGFVLDGRIVRGLPRSGLGRALSGG